MKQKKASAERRAWRKARSAAVVSALRGLGALQDPPIELPKAAMDIGQARSAYWRNGGDKAQADTVVHRARRRFEQANPKPQ